jgi:hypothetical protein
LGKSLRKWNAFSGMHHNYRRARVGFLVSTDILDIPSALLARTSP